MFLNDFLHFQDYFPMIINIFMEKVAFFLFMTFSKNFVKSARIWGMSPAEMESFFAMHLSKSDFEGGWERIIEISNHHSRFETYPKSLGSKPKNLPPKRGLFLGGSGHTNIFFSFEDMTSIQKINLFKS